MNIGDLVSWHGHTGVVVRVYRHKVWRTHEMGKSIDWNKAATEPFADVMINSRLSNIKN